MGTKETEYNRKVKILRDMLKTIGDADERSRIEHNISAIEATIAGNSCLGVESIEMAYEQALSYISREIEGIDGSTSISKRGNGYH